MPLLIPSDPDLITFNRNQNVFMPEADPPLAETVSFSHSSGSYVRAQASPAHPEISGPVNRRCRDTFIVGRFRSVDRPDIAEPPNPV